MRFFSGFVSDTKDKTLIINPTHTTDPMMLLWNTMVKKETGYVLQLLKKKQTSKNLPSLLSGTITIWQGKQGEPIIVYS